MSKADGGGGGGAIASHVYVRSDEYAWIPSRLVEQDHDIAKVLIPQYESEDFIMSDGGKAAVGFNSASVKLKDYQGRALPLQNCGSDGTLKEVDDMIDLPYLHEAAILYNLKKRHRDGKPYSRLGDIVIAVNPYQWLGDLYTDNVRLHYAQKIVWDHDDRDPRIGLPPHLYEVSSLCYKGLVVERQNQSILVTGISGAGKTETVKICIDHIATIQRDPNDKSTSESMAVKRILDSNRLLEAFGNATTRYNDNSSRFGKYTRLQFHHVDAKKLGDRPRSSLVGSTCEVYFLEKSRVVSHDKSERTFHAFYQLLSAPDDKKAEIWKGLKGTRNESFAYVGASPSVLIDGKEDSAHFDDTNAALELLGIRGEKKLTLWRAIAACLQIGNLKFANKSEKQRSAVVTSRKVLNDLAELLVCDNNVLEKAFTERTIKTSVGEERKFSLDFRQAKQRADVFASEIYAKTFLWLVRSINDSTCVESNYPGGSSINYGLIGLLDIFGFDFETFPSNGFEKLCINYCCEKLQQKFNYDIVRIVQEEYKAEGLSMDEIEHDGNSDVLELIEGELGIFNNLNEICFRRWYNSLHYALRNVSCNPCVIGKPTFYRRQFGIRHHTGVTIYQAHGFVESNRDTLPNEILEAAKMCRNEIISKHLDNKRCSNVEVTNRKFAADHVHSQMTNLMKSLNETQSRYVYCINPNTRKRKLALEHIATMKQLRGAGVVAAVLTSRSTYPTKLLHAEFVERYGILYKDCAKINNPVVMRECEDICNKKLKHFETKRERAKKPTGFAMGKNRVYFRSGCLQYLELERSKILEKLNHATIDSWVSCSSSSVANNVYIRSDEYGWIPAQLLEQDKDTAKVSIPQYESEVFIMSDGGKGAIRFISANAELKDYQGRALPLQNCASDGTLQEVDDLADLPYIHEAAVLYNLKKRHCDGKPYSRLGDIVIAVNPYQWLGDLYTDNVRLHYAQKIVWDHDDRDPRIGLPPHLYEVSSLCYKGLAVERRNQSILVAGISGAGKTETVKICIDHLATIQQDPNDKSSGKSMAVKRILDSNRLLEAFGNATTRYNDNSSRFGKYTRLQFHHVDAKKPGDRPRSSLVGSTCEVYLLEKSRVVFHDRTERTFHAFYQLLSAPDDKKAEIWKGLKGTRNESFAYVGTAPFVLIDGKEDNAHFDDTNAALDLLGISGEKKLTLWCAIAACLQIGNLKFAPKIENEDQTVVTSRKELNDLAELIGCDNDALEKAFTERTIKSRAGEEYKVPLRFDQVKQSTDAFASEIYAKTFLWLVRSINDATCVENNDPGGASINNGLIGLLDMFGFESCPTNGFEQLCINYCCEKLQQKFNCDIFRTVLEEYKADDLSFDVITYDDNSDVVELIEGKHVGIISLLQAYYPVPNRPYFDDDAFVWRIYHCQRVPCTFYKSTFCRHEFGIHHFAGALIYNFESLLVRNTGTLPNEICEVAKLCKNEIISKHLENNRCSNLEIKDEMPLPKRGPPKRTKHNLVPDGVMTQLKNQLTKLMNSLNETQSRYICCVNPNTQKRKLVMEHISTMKQLQCSGIVAATLMSRSTYPSKLFHAEVVERYRMLNEGNVNVVYPDVKSECDDICRQMLKHFEATINKSGMTIEWFAIGKTRAYFRSEFLEFLESERSKRLGEVDDASFDSWVYCSSTDFV